MEAFRLTGRLPAAAAGVLAVVLAMSAHPARAADRAGGGDYILASPALSIDDVSQFEGNSGASAFTFTVSISKLSSVDVQVDVQTADGTATEANTDYFGVSTTLTIPAGELSTTVDVLVFGDAIREQDETFLVNLSNPVNATLADPQGVGTIKTEDVSPCLSIKDVAIIEGDSGKSLAMLKVTLSNPTDQVVTVDFTTYDGTGASPATIANNDYQATSGTLTFPAKSTASQDIGVPINGDANLEGDEHFRVILSNILNATICDSTGIVTILDDEVTATLLSQFAVDAVDEGVALQWQFGDPASIQKSWIERADAATGPWATIDAEVRTEEGLLKMVDRSVEPEHTYFYRVSAVLSDGQTLKSGALSTTTVELVKEFALSRIAPNPTNGPARIDYALPRQAKVRLTVLDVQGRIVTTLVDGEVKAGRHQAEWSGASRASARPGMYFVRFEAGGKSFVKRLALMQ